MREVFGHDYPPAKWTAEGIAEALRSTPERYPLSKYDDEATWSEVRRDDVTGPVVDDILERAEDARKAEMPRLPATLYLEYVRTGNRSRYQDAWRARQRRLGLFTLAECFERDGRYLDPILDHAWAITEQATWVWPAHLRGAHNVDGLPRPVDDEERTVTLFNAGMAKVPRRSISSSATGFPTRSASVSEARPTTRSSGPTRPGTILGGWPPPPTTGTRCATAGRRSSRCASSMIPIEPRRSSRRPHTTSKPTWRISTKPAVRTVARGERGRATITPAPDRDVGVEVERLENAVDDKDVWRGRFVLDVPGDSTALELAIDPVVTSASG